MVYHAVIRLDYYPVLATGSIAEGYLTVGDTTVIGPCINDGIVTGREIELEVEVQEMDSRTGKTDGRTDDYSTMRVLGPDEYLACRRG